MNCCYKWCTDFESMSLEQLNAFLAKVKGDTSLQGKLKDAKSSDEVVSIAKEHGHVFSVEHINQVRADQLERIAGGGECIERTVCISVENSLLD